MINLHKHRRRPIQVDKSKYFEIHTGNVEDCLKNPCLVNTAIKSTFRQDNEFCGVNLFFANKKDINCEFDVHEGVADFFQILQPQGVIFSTLEPAKLTIVCPYNQNNEPINSLEIKGSGILQIPPSCQGLVQGTHTVTLPGPPSSTNLNADDMREIRADLPNYYLKDKGKTRRFKLPETPERVINSLRIKSLDDTIEIMKTKTQKSVKIIIYVLVTMAIILMIVVIAGIFIFKRQWNLLRLAKGLGNLITSVTSKETKQPIKSTPPEEDEIGGAKNTPRQEGVGNIERDNYKGATAMDSSSLLNNPEGETYASYSNPKFWIDKMNASLNRTRERENDLEMIDTAVGIKTAYARPIPRVYKP